MSMQRNSHQKDRWHTVTPIAAGVCMITQPLGSLEPSFGVKTANIYLVTGEQRAAVIDTGLGIGDVGQVAAGLTSLPLLALNTHYHWDHSGGNADFAGSAIHEIEAQGLEEEEHMAWFLPSLRTAEARAVLPPGFDPAAYSIPPRPATRLLADGDLIDLGGRQLVALHTPGHSPGHLAYWDEANGLLFTGDMAYQGPLYACFRESDPAAFLASAQRLSALSGVRLICPGHNRLLDDHGFLKEIARAMSVALAGDAVGQPRTKPFRGREIMYDGFSLWLPPSD